MPRNKEFDQQEALEKAMAVFWSKGYEAASTRELVDSMGISHGSLYNTFHDKYSLYLATLDNYIQHNIADLERKLQGPESVKEAFTGLFACVIANAHSDGKGCFLANATVELAGHHPQINQRVERSHARTEAVFAQALQRAQQRGELLPGCHPTAAARLLYSVVSGIQVRAKSNTDPAVLRDSAQMVLSLLFQ